MKRLMTAFIPVVMMLCICVLGLAQTEEYTVNETAKGDYGSCEEHIYANGGEYTVVNEPTCTLKGTKYRSCLVCGFKEIVETPKDPDNHSLVSNELTYETKPTCVTGGVGYYVCRGCNKAAERVELEPDPEAHAKNGDFIVLLPETCQLAGTMAHQCKYCDAYFNHQSIPSDPEAHVTSEESSWVVTVLPTCDTAGSMNCYCDLCGDVALTKEVPATGEHTPTEEWFVITEETCSADGVTAQLCTVCNNPVNETAIPADPDKHVFAEEFTVDVPATCVSEGLQSRHCLYCDAKTEETVVPVDNKAHSYTDEWIVTQEPTCSQAGYKHKVCTLCDEDSISTLIAKLPHNYPEEYEVLQESADGLSARVKYICQDCSYQFVTVITFGEHDGSGDVGADIDPITKILKIKLIPETVIKVDYEAMMISNVKRNLTVEDFLKYFTNSHLFVIYNPKSEFINEEDNIGTGCRLNYETVDGVVTNYYVSVTGDLDSDGKVTAADARLLLRASAKIDNLSGAFAIAADVNLDGKITAADARKTLLVAANMTYFEETYEY